MLFNGEMRQKFNKNSKNKYKLVQMSSANDFKAQGNAFFKEQKFNEALECYNKAIELDATNHVFFSNRSGTYASLGQFEQSLEDANAALNIKGDHINSISRKGHALLNLGRLDEAVQAYESGLEIDSSSEKLLNGIATVKAHKAQVPGTGPGNGFPGGMGGFGGGMPGQNQQQQMLMQLLSNPETAGLFQDPAFMAKFQDVQSNPANLTKYLNDPDVMKVLSALSGGGAGGMGGMAGMFGGGQGSPFAGQGQDSAPQSTPQQSQPEEKMAEETPAVDLHIKEAADKKAEGTTLYKAGNVEGALACYKQAAELDEYNLLYKSNVVACLTMLKRYDEGLTACEEAIKVHKSADYEFRNSKNLAKIYAKRARIYELQGKMEEALQEYDAALLEDNDGKIKLAQKNLKKKKIKMEKEAYINPEIAEEERQKGNAFFKEGNFAKAIASYDEAIKRNPNECKTHNNKAMCYIKLLEFNLAMKSVDKAIEMDPKYLKAWNRKATIHHFLKEYHKALDAYKVVLSMEETNQEALTGIQKTQMAIQSSMNDGNDEERMQRAMADPEIQ